MRLLHRYWTCRRRGHEWRTFDEVKWETGDRTGQILEMCIRCNLLRKVGRQ